MGVAYQVEDGELGEEYALKLILPGLLGEGEGEEVLRREVMATRHLEGSRHIVRVYDVGRHGAAM